MNTKWILNLLIMPLLLGLVACSQGGTPADGSGGGTPANNPAGTFEGNTNPNSGTTDNPVQPIIPASLAKLILDASANGTTQQLAAGETMVITLESNPSTGYSWMATSSNPAVVALMGEPVYIAPLDNGTPVVGAAGTQTFTFQAAKSGEVTLTLVYVRPWEKDATPEKTFTVTVEVK